MWSMKVPWNQKIVNSEGIDFYAMNLFQIKIEKRKRRKIIEDAQVEQLNTHFYTLVYQSSIDYWNGIPHGIMQCATMSFPKCICL